MDEFDDIPFIKLIPGRVPSSPPVDPNAIASGLSWTLFYRDETYVVDYVSGELMGRERTLTVTAKEAEDIKAEGDTAIYRIFMRHSVG